MTLHLCLSPAQAFALRDALAGAARNPDYDYELDPIWDTTCDYCTQRLTQHQPSATDAP